MESILDIMVVVFGVLIALFINNLNDNRKRKKRMTSILDIVKENMLQDIDMINKEIPRLEEKAVQIRRLLDSNIKYEELSFDEKKFFHSFLFAYPQTILIQKEGYRLLRDADLVVSIPIRITI